MCFSVADLDLQNHDPVIASVGLPFVVVELKTRDALSRARVNRDAFDAHMDVELADAIYLYTRKTEDQDGDVDFTARMFAPYDNVPEDPATGSATGAACALLASLENRADRNGEFRVAQGIDMKRPSQLRVTVDVANLDSPNVKISGSAVPVMAGTITV